MPLQSSGNGEESRSSMNVAAESPMANSSVDVTAANSESNGDLASDESIGEKLASLVPPPWFFFFVTGYVAMLMQLDMTKHSESVLQLEEQTKANIKLVNKIREQQSLNYELQQQIDESDIKKEVVENERLNKDLTDRQGYQKARKSEWEKNLTDESKRVQTLRERLSHEKTKQIQLLEELAEEKMQRGDLAVQLSKQKAANFVWNVERLFVNRTYKRGDVLTSTLFILGSTGSPGLQMRLHFLPSGLSTADEGYCSIYVSAPVGWSLTVTLFIAEEASEGGNQTPSWDTILQTGEFTPQKPYWGIKNFLKFPNGTRFSRVGLKLHRSNFSGLRKTPADALSPTLAHEKYIYVWNISSFSSISVQSQKAGLRSPAFILQGIPGLHLVLSKGTNCSLFLVVPSHLSWSVRARLFLGDNSKTFARHDFHAQQNDEPYGSETYWGFTDFPVPDNWTIAGVEVLYAKPLTTSQTRSNYYTQLGLNLNSRAIQSFRVQAEPQAANVSAQEDFEDY